ncbi:putative alpha-13-mannosyltransferase MNT4 [Spathaspora sp. JA1]|nr:putative alpha-13-mannosyltransferase MNT4 [Spathaspora sp. JA1]
MKYFQDLSQLYPNEPIVDLESTVAQITDPLLYKKSAWIRERESEVKRSATRKLTKEVEKQLERDYVRETQKQSKVEKSIVEQFNHMRIFGKCFLNDIDIDDKKLCQGFQNKLYPWMSGKYPNFEHWKSSGKLPRNTLPIFDKLKQQIEVDENSNCFIQQFKQQSNGKGIVIPFYPTNEQSRDKQIDNISRIIKVLRALKNRKPIQIVHMNSLTREEKNLLIDAARTEIRYLPWSYLNYFEFFKKEDEVYRVVTDVHYPQQDLWFVDVNPVKNTQQHPGMVKHYLFNNINFLVSLSMLFNSFEEAIVITEHALPLLEKADYFQDHRYKETGLLFFKNPTILSKRPKRFNPGFHEVTSLVKSLLTPTDFDSKYFGLYKRNEDVIATNRFFQDSFQDILDPSIMIINKTKALSGLLISVNFQLQSTFNIRFPSGKNKLTPDFIWISQEIAGNHNLIQFNDNQAVAAGIFTPKEILPKDVTQSQEICSSSWGQLSDSDDVSLLYVTSHQLQNWRNQGGDHFQQLLKDKYKVITTEQVKNMFSENEQDKVDMDRENNDIFEQKLTSNPMTIEGIIRPPTITQPIFVHGYNEPNEPWVLPKDFQQGIIHPYYCVYDIVGNPLKEGVRGMVSDIGGEMKARLKFLLDVWFEDIQED